MLFCTFTTFVVTVALGRQYRFDMVLIAPCIASAISGFLSAWYFCRKKPSVKKYWIGICTFVLTYLLILALYFLPGLRSAPTVQILRGALLTTADSLASSGPFLFLAFLLWVYVAKEKEIASPPGDR